MESSTVSMEQEFQDFVSDDLINEAAKQNLLPASPKEGYEGVVVKYELRTFEPTTSKGEANALYGHRVYRVTIELYNVDGKTRPHYIDMSSEKLFTKAGNRLIEASILGAQLAKVTGERSLVLAFEKAKVNRYHYVLKTSDAANGYAARNWTTIKA